MLQAGEEMGQVLQQLGKSSAFTLGRDFRKQRKKKKAGQRAVFYQRLELGRHGASRHFQHLQRVDQFLSRSVAPFQLDLPI